MSGTSYTIEEVAKLLRVSKLTIYDLIKKGKLPAFRVGRQMRVDAADLEAYKKGTKGQTPIEIEQDLKLHARTPIHSEVLHLNTSSSQGVRSVVITGQDPSLDLLSRYIEKESTQYRPLRSFVGSLDSLLAMYQGNADIVSSHLYDGETGQYNIPYIRRLFVSQPFLVIRLLSRKIGLYVQKGNPLQIYKFSDLVRPRLTFINREQGCGVRTFLDEQLRIHGFASRDIAGYDHVVTNHIGVAGKVATHEADVGLGIEHAASLVDVDFVPLGVEQYDLVLLKKPENSDLIQTVLSIVQSGEFRKELGTIRGYNTEQTGWIVYET